MGTETRAEDDSMCIGEDVEKNCPQIENEKSKEEKENCRTAAEICDKKIESKCRICAENLLKLKLPIFHVFTEDSPISRDLLRNIKKYLRINVSIKILSNFYSSY